MATKLICDGGCGKESPDVHGLFIANYWVKVTAKVPFWRGLCDREMKLVLCRDCARGAFEAIGQPLREGSDG